MSSIGSITFKKKVFDDLCYCVYQNNCFINPLVWIEEIDIER